MSSTGVILVMITEDGFLRGWLWASLKRTGQSDKAVLLWTTFAFMVWHISTLSLDTGSDLPAREIPIYLIRGTILSLIWGIMRMVSGSVLVPAVSHCVWNGIDYPLIRLRRESRRARDHGNSPLRAGSRSARNRAGCGLFDIALATIRDISRAFYLRHFIDLRFSAAILPAARMIG